MNLPSLKDKNHEKSRNNFYIILSLIVVFLTTIFIWFRVSPVPSSFIIRIFFNADAASTSSAQFKYVDKNIPVTAIKDIKYRNKQDKSSFDIYIPNNAIRDKRKLPLIIWTHGGAWISGDKSYMSAYFKLLANEGFVVASLNYALAPDQKYPYQIHQINDAHKFITENGDSFNIDTTKIVLAGSSAGAQLSAQLATIITNKSYSEEIEIAPNLKSEQLSAVVLYSGIYDMRKLASAKDISSRIISWGFKTASWVYTGEKDPESDILFQASPANYLSSRFPATFISGGNGDALTNLQSVPFAEKLTTLNVPVVALFYPKDYEPILKHENQFTFDKDSIQNFQIMSDFIRNKTK